jgi:hypothetical protein
MKIKFISCLLIFCTASAFAITKEAQLPLPCQNLKSTLQKIIPSTLTITDKRNSTMLCQFTATGTGLVFEKNKKDFASWRQLLNTTLQKNGWHETKATLKLTADGPFSTQFALAKNKLIAQINISVAGDTKACPKDSPMDLYENCGLTAKDRNYSLQINIK